MSATLPQPALRFTKSPRSLPYAHAIFPHLTTCSCSVSLLLHLVPNVPFCYSHGACDPDRCESLCAGHAPNKSNRAFQCPVRLARDWLELHWGRTCINWHDHVGVYSSDKPATDASCGAWDAILLRSITRYRLYCCCCVLSYQSLLSNHPSRKLKGLNFSTRLSCVLMPRA